MVKNNFTTMKKEESIERTNKVIHSLETAIEDIKEMSQHFIDFDDNMEGLGPLDNIGGQEGMKAYLVK